MEAWCDFIPFAVETFDVWSPFLVFTLRALYSIDECTTAGSGAFKTKWLEETCCNNIQCTTFGYYYITGQLCSVVVPFFAS